jgi:hypothetical protein
MEVWNTLYAILTNAISTIIIMGKIKISMVKSVLRNFDKKS